MPYTSTTNMIIIGPRHELNEVFHSASGYAGGARAEYTFNNPGGLFSLSASGKPNANSQGASASPDTGWNTSIGQVVYGAAANADVNFTSYDYSISGNKAGFIYGPTSSTATLLINQTGSRHNQLFWAYYGSGSTGNDPTTWSTNAKNFLSGSKNLAYNIFTGRTAPNGTFLGPFLVNQADGNPGLKYTGSRLIPVINGGYDYSASAQLASDLINNDGLFILTGNNTKQTLRFSTPTLETLRLDSIGTFGNTPNGQYAGQFNPLTSSYFQDTRGTNGTGSYNFFRGPFFPIANYICGEIPVFITMSFTNCRSSGNPGANTHLQLNIYKTEEGAAPTLLTSSFGSVPDSSNPGTVVISASITPRSGSFDSQVNLSTWQSAYRQGIIFELQNTSTSPAYAMSCSQITTTIEQPFGPGRQHYHHIYWESSSAPTSDYPQPNNTGSYYVITPYLSGSDNINVDGNTPASWQIPTDATSFAVMNFTHRVYYFKSALDLWRNAWQVQGINGQPFCTQAEWISASTNPTWASVGGYVTAGVPWTASTNGAERMAAYVGITAELLGGSLTSLKLKSTQNGPTGSAAFNKGGGMIVVRANNAAAATVTTDPNNINFQLQDPNSAPGANNSYPIGGVVSFRTLPAVNTETSDYDWPVNYNWPSANPYAGPPGL